MVALIMPILSYGQMIKHPDKNSGFSEKKDSQKQSSDNQILDLEPFICDSINSIDKRILSVMESTWKQKRSFADRHELYGIFEAKLGKTRYNVLYDWHWLEAIYEIYLYREYNPDFHVKDLHFGDRVDLSKYEKVATRYTPYRLYKIAGTNWAFCVSSDDNEIFAFWRKCKKNDLLVDEVMLYNM